MSEDRENQVLMLSDGRRLGWGEFGDLRGFPVLYCHGWPGSHIEASLLSQAARRSGVRLIAADRPGMGLSDHQPGRRFADWPRDAKQLTDALGLQRFAVLGVSGGTPYALSCAVSLPQRITRVAIVSGMGPIDRPNALEGMRWWNRLLLRVAARMPRTTRILYNTLVRGLARAPRLALAVMRVLMPEPDRSVLARPEIRQFFPLHLGEIFRQGPLGSADDGELYTQPWGIELRKVRLPVQLWHGEADVAVPAAMGRYLSERIPDCQCRYFAEEGHLSLLIDRAEEILCRLTAA